MFFYRLPPAGEPIVLQSSAHPEHDTSSIFEPLKVEFYGSGTQSLSAAIKAAISIRGVSSPEVILPAYACPSLVSAAYYAGAKPILVDLAAQRPWIDLEDLQKRINKNTVAIVAVNLFGIPERIEALREIAQQVRAYIIEDSAQFFPDSKNDMNWKGDYIVLSFGRGKPVSLLGGGAVLCDKENLFSFLPKLKSAAEPANTKTQLARKLKIQFYNIFRIPYLYWIFNALPFTKVGETIFEPLEDISAIERSAMALLPSNIQLYWKRSSNTPIYTEMLKEIGSDEIIDLPLVCCEKTIPRLIRYPVLFHSHKQRESIYYELNKHGLGASRMYNKPLNCINGLEDKFRSQGPFPNAEIFADCLLTLPTIMGLQYSDIEKIKNIFSTMEGHSSTD